MDTKQIPTVVMLIGGAASCVISLVRQSSAGTMLQWLLITLICFYILGQVIRVIIVKNFADVLGLKKKSEEENDTEEQPDTKKDEEDETEDATTESASESEE